RQTFLEKDAGGGAEKGGAIGHVKRFARSAAGFTQAFEKCVFRVGGVNGRFVVHADDHGYAAFLDLASEIRVLAEGSPTGSEAALSAYARRVAGHAPDAQG